MREAFRFSGTRRRLGKAFAGSVAVAMLAARAHADPSSLPPEVGYNYGLMEPPRTAGMAGAQRAFSNSTDALYVNPANMASSRVYQIGALGQIWPEARRQSYGAAIVDSVVSSSRIAGGVGVNWTGQEPSGVDRNALDVRFALAFPFSDHVFLGAAGRYLSMKQGGFPRGLYSLPPSLAASGRPDQAIVQTITFDAGLTVKPIPELGFALVGQNLTNPDNTFLPLMLGGGVAYGTSDFTFEVDSVGDFTTYAEAKSRVMVGGELLAADRFPLRLGYRYDEGQVSHAVTGGVGYLDTSYSIDLAFQRVVSGGDATAIIIGFKYHVESGSMSTDNLE